MTNETLQKMKNAEELIRIQRLAHEQLRLRELTQRTFSEMPNWQKEYAKGFAEVFYK